LQNIKRFVGYLGPNLAQNEKTEEWVTFVTSVTHDRSENLR